MTTIGERGGAPGMQWDLLEKTIFWIEGIDLHGTDLGSLASAAAAALDLEYGEVMVVDVRPGKVAFDVLRREISPESVVGKEKKLLRSLKEVPGVCLGADGAVHSEGVLGFITLESREAAGMLAVSAAMTAEVGRKVSRRVLVFASGSELLEEKIRDTNSPYLIETLSAAGHSVNFGGILRDELGSVVASLEDAIGQGFGLVITTGGVGAEDKDVNIEAILRLDPQAHTPWILKFTPDMRRHHKEGVRIAVGRVGVCRLVALPGPHEEVRLAGTVLLKGLERGASDEDLAETLAEALRKRWKAKMTKGIGFPHGH